MKFNMKVDRVSAAPSVICLTGESPHGRYQHEDEVFDISVVTHNRSRPRGHGSLTESAVPHGISAACLGSLLRTGSLMVL